MNSIKLQAFLAHHGLASRRQAEVLIEEGRVQVNGVQAHIGQRIDPDKDEVKFNGETIQPLSKLVYYIVNKPRGYLSTTMDELERRTVLEILPQHKERLYPVGRLDMESEGLMLLTNDGDLAYHLTHPKFEILKTYHVLVEGHPTDKALEFLRRGVKLKSTWTKPAQVEVIDSEDDATWVEVIIHEGKNHQVRNMLKRAGYETLKLIRVTLGPLDLGDLDGRPYRLLTPEEVENLKTKVRSK